MNRPERLKQWTLRVPSVWGQGQAELHSSLLIMLGLLAALICIIGLSRTGFAELLPAAVTLPVVWLLSLTVRMAAQQFSMGEAAGNVEITIGPAGNLSTDYEYLPPHRVLVYAVSGQIATLSLVLLGLIVHGASIQAAGHSDVTAARLLDLKGGWHSDAWASQIMWVNIFLLGLHLLPTVPFDARAFLFAFFSLPPRDTHEPRVFRKLSSLVFHLASFLAGIGLATLVIGLALQRDIPGWYAALAAAAYLWIAGRWEMSRAIELEEHCVPVLRRHSAHVTPAPASHIKFSFGAGATESRQHGGEQPTVAGSTTAGASGRLDEHEVIDSGISAAVPDIDEILRKIHRQGRDSLSPSEQEALMSASRKFQQRRDA